MFPLQFGDIGIDRLEMQLGEFSPMGFLWTFMAYSKFWTFCTGLVETVAGVLLLFRKTTFLGAFIGFIAMINVVLMDVGYDVSVKMFAVHLFLMTLILLADDLQRLINFFVLNRATEPRTAPPLLEGRRLRVAGYAVKGILILYFSITTVIEVRGRLTNEHDHRNEAVSMLHRVTTFVINGDTLPPLADSGVRWKNFSVNGSWYDPDGLVVRYMNETKKPFSFEADTLKHVLTFRAIEDSTDTIRSAIIGCGKKTVLFLKVCMAPTRSRLKHKGENWLTIHSRDFRADGSATFEVHDPRLTV